MSNKLNYGKKFNSGMIIGPTKFDPSLHPKNWGGGFNPTLFPRNDLQKALSIGKAQGNTKQSKARVGKLPNGDPPPPKVKSRTEYEKEFGTMIAEVVTRLEHGLEELNMAPPLAKGEVSLINRRQVMEAISRLKGGFYRTGQQGVVGNSGGQSYRRGKYR